MIEEPFNYTVALKGKDLRSEFIEIFAKWTGADSKRIEIVKNVIRILHNASLMIDDIEDEAEVRRGQPCAYKVFGVALTLNAANLAYFKALEQVLLLDDLTAVQDFTRECIALHEGQGMEIWHRDTKKKPTEADYYKIIEGKTGGLFRLSLRLLGAPSEELLDIGNEIGILYQMIDDYRNLFGRSEDDESFADDLREGKFTLTTIHGLSELERTPELNERIKIVKKLKETGSRQYTFLAIESRLKRFKAKTEALAEIESIYFHLEQLIGCFHEP